MTAQTSSDPFTQFKAAQREGWGLFVPVENITTAPAAHLVNFAKIKEGEKVLDVGCGTGVVAVTAARRGARVKALDLSPVLLERARWNAGVAGVDVDFTEGDAEKLPYKDGEFDVVVSQFGHMFAPRPEIAISEMLRVLKPGGRIAFSTWPPHLFTGRLFALTGRYLPPPEGVAPPPLWGDPKTIRERLGDKVKNLVHESEILLAPVLSPQHARTFFVTTVAPLAKVAQTFKDDVQKLNQFHADLESLVAEYLKDNMIRQHFIMTRAFKN